MPEMNGPELAARLRAKWPEVKVLYISGYTEGRLTDHEIMKGTKLIQKPFTRHSLINEVRQALDV
jgi:FixJ family two-component response regulator